MILNFEKIIRIGEYVISDSSHVFIIAEAGVNHNGDMDLAKKLIDVAVTAGANAVKFQAFQTEQLILKDVKKAKYQQNSTDTQQSQYEMLSRLELSKHQNIELLNYCRKNDIIFLTTPFDELSLDELDDLDLPAYKISSTDLTNLPFLRKIALKGKPLILSTGMSYLSEVELALQAINKINKKVILLQCTANYPIDDNEANLNVIQTYKNRFDIIVGYSDHTKDSGASPYAVPLGAKLIEKHFTHDKTLKGPDHKASLNPEQLKDFIYQIRKVEEFLGSHIKTPTLSEMETRSSLQKYLVASKFIKNGEIITEDSVVAKRTGGVGISPIYISTIIGKRASKDYNENDIINE